MNHNERDAYGYCRICGSGPAVNMRADESIDLLRQKTQNEQTAFALDQSKKEIAALEKENAELLAARKEILSAAAELAKELGGISNDGIHEILMQQARRIAQALNKPSTQEVSRPRLIPDVECKQGKCACTTTGCWGKCSLVISQNQEVSK